jgi:mono/diheme cytochrome c family protein
MKEINGWVSLSGSGMIIKTSMFIVLSLLAGQWIGLAGCRETPYRQGQDLYIIHCEHCHMKDGSGLAKLIPALDASKLTLSDPGKLVCLIRKGLPVNQQTGQQMPPNTSLNDVEMTNLINFLGSKYSSNTQTVQVKAVKKLLGACQTE